MITYLPTKEEIKEYQQMQELIKKSIENLSETMNSIK